MLTGQNLINFREQEKREEIEQDIPGKIIELQEEIEEPRKTINDIKFVLEITDEIVFNLPEYPTEEIKEK